MGVMALTESRAGQMDLHVALNYSRHNDKRYKKAKWLRQSDLVEWVKVRNSIQVNLGQNTARTGVSL
jgi:hypothetical protein